MSSSNRTKQARDHALEFQDLLNDLQDWERSMNEKEKKLRGESEDSHNMVSAAKQEKKDTSRTSQFERRKQQSKLGLEASYRSNTQPQVSYLKRSKEIASMSISADDDNTPNAVSEKEQGNEYFKQKKFEKAVDCYSRSIALSPTAVAFGNRAMAYLKIRKFQEAEDDCTESLNLDDRYVKAYSRRATARKELGKYQASFEDAEFALRLEPDNQELKKQYTELKALYDQAKVKKSASAAMRSVKEVKGKGSSAPVIEEVASGAQLVKERPQTQKPGIASGSQQQIKGDNHDNIRQKTNLNVQELASRATSRVTQSSSKTISVPKTAYQFEKLWRGFSDDRALQSRLLKTIDPLTLPRLFKNALTAPVLMDIVKCVADFFVEDTIFAIGMLDNLSKVARFDMIMMCLSDVDRADLWRMWDNIFMSKNIAEAHMDALQKLHSKYCPQQWRVHVLQSNNSVTGMTS